MRTLIRDSEGDSIMVWKKYKTISTYMYFEYEEQDAELVTVDLSVLDYLENVHPRERIEELAKAIAKHYGLELKEMIVLVPFLPCTEEYALECKDNNMICYLLRALYPNQDPEDVGICHHALSRQISLTDIRSDIVKALTKYAREQLRIREPVLFIMTDGPVELIAIATKWIHQ